MESDEEDRIVKSRSKAYQALRADLSAALTAFDRAQDWADLIHDLQRVNRVLNKYTNSSFLPEKKLLSKRLAQCLTSSLPSGVHLKALETYRIVFSRIGPAKLAKDLPLYAGGLFPVFSYCATSLKSPLLSLYENHFLPLGRSLAPIVDGLVLAILPGVEDESSEFYARSFKLLDDICYSVGDPGVFARGLWRALLLAPEMRLNAAHYLRTKLASGNNELRNEMVKDMPLVSYAISKALSDQNALVQRCVLDLLLGELSLNSPFFATAGKIHYDAAVALVGGVFGALLRRDMSLTKRVHSWILGGKEGDEGIRYCKKYSRDIILAAIGREMSAAIKPGSRSTASGLTRPCKVISALIDRDEILICVGDELSFRILEYGKASLASEFSSAKREVQHALGEVLQQIGTASILEELENSLREKKSPSRADFELLLFALSVLSLGDNDVHIHHLPALLSVGVTSLGLHSMGNEALDRGVAFCSKVLSCISRQQRASVSVTEVVKSVTSSIERFTSFFIAWLAQTIRSAPLALRHDYEGLSVSEEIDAEVEMSSSKSEDPDAISLAKEGCSFLVISALSVFGTLSIIDSALQASAKCSAAMDVRVSLAGARAYSSVVGRGLPVSTRNSEHFTEQTLGVIRRVWRQLHPSLQTATPQSAQVFLLLQRQFPEQARIVVADGILSTAGGRRLRNLERFACLWNHSIEHHLRPRPADDGLFLMLDSLSDDEWGPKMLARAWLSDALAGDAASVLDAPLRLLLTPQARNVGDGHSFAGVYDAPRALYAFQILRNVIESCSSTRMDNAPESQIHPLDAETNSRTRPGKHNRTGIWALVVSPPSKSTSLVLEETLGSRKSDSSSNSNEAQSTREGDVRLWPLLPAPNYVSVIALTAFNYLRGVVPERYDHAAMNALDIMEGKKMIDEDRKNTQSNTVSLEGESEDSELWMLVGLGSRSFRLLHDSVSAAAAECLARTLMSIPAPTRTSIAIASSYSQPLLSLIAKQSRHLDPVMQLHYLDSVESLVHADGPAYRTTAGRSESRLVESSSSTSVNATPAQDPASLETHRQFGISIGSLERQELFLPWMLQEVFRVCGPSNHAETVGSQEVLGLRQRWIRFICSVISHVGRSLPSIAEGLILVFSNLLSEANSNSANQDKQNHEKDFPRVDDRVILLKGISSITTSLLWSFELALTAHDVRDEAQGNSALGLPESTSNAALGLDSSNVALPLPASSVNSVAGIDHARDHNRSEMPGVVGENMSAGSFTRESDLANANRTATTTGASAMMNAINPLRLFNDFVKDVFTGGGSEFAQRPIDPRRAAARLLFWYLPDLVSASAILWSSFANDMLSPSNLQKERVPISPRKPNGSLSSPDPGIPRLSRDLSRERQHSQRRAVVLFVEPLFALRPIDVVACVVTQFCPKYDDGGAKYSGFSTSPVSRAAVNVLHSIEHASAHIVVNCVANIAEQAMKWDSKSLAAADGRENKSRRSEASSLITNLVKSGEWKSDQALGAVGNVITRDDPGLSSGGTVGLDFSSGNPLDSESNSNRQKQLFCPGDFFARFSPGDVEIACFRFLKFYFETSKPGNDIESTWHIFNGLVRDCVGSSTRKATIVGALVSLAAFIEKCSDQFPDKRQRKDVVQIVGMLVESCRILGAGSMDLSNEPNVTDPKEAKSRLAVFALDGLATAVPPLVAKAFLEDKQHLANLLSSALSPAISTLKRTASRSAAMRSSEDRGKQKKSTTKVSNDRTLDDERDQISSMASANLMLEISRRDWGVKQARRELVTLIDDPNFFFGKRGGLVRKMADIVREVIAGGGATSLLASIGTNASNNSAGIPVLFSGRDSEAVVRSRAIRRVAFCAFVSEPDHYSPQLPSVLERLRDALRLADPNLVIECLLCLRVLLLKSGPGSISAFRATTLSELFRIISNPSENLKATVSALQYLDLLTLISPPDNAYERCFFFAENSTGDKSSGFEPLLSTLAKPSAQEEVVSPFRLEGGMTVFNGQFEDNIDMDFIANYASALCRRNSDPGLATANAAISIICRELGEEFVE